MDIGSPATGTSPSSAARSTRLPCADSSVDRHTTPFDSIPDEILMEVWLFLDMASLRNFSKSCRRFRAFSKSSFSRAQYFLKRHAPHSIHRAIHYCDSFSSDLFHMLLKGGAKLSRALVQSLICNRMQVESMDYVFDIAGTWGSNIPMSSMAAILQEACRLYGDNIQLVYDEMDQVKFEDWISFPDSMYADNEIEELFTKANFLPLPHSSCIYNDMAKAISKWPKIFSLAKANGWILEDEDRDEVFRCILKNVGQDPQEIAENAKGLSKDPDLWISKTVASEVIKRMFEHPVGLTSHSNSVSSPNELVSTPYKALLLLDRRGDLRFPLEEVVKDTLIPLGFQLNHDFKAQVLFRLSEDFPIINAMAGWPMVGSVFSLDSKGNGLSMDEIHERLKNIEVKEDYILKALVKNSAQKATPLLYARKYLGGFDEKRFLEERLLPQLIEQPYKGKLLLSLNKEVDGFEELLEKEIIKQDFEIDQLQFIGNSKHVLGLHHEHSLMASELHLRLDERCRIAALRAKSTASPRVPCFKDFNVEQRMKIDSDDSILLRNPCVMSVEKNVCSDSLSSSTSAFGSVSLNTLRKSSTSDLSHADRLKKEFHTFENIYGFVPKDSLSNGAASLQILGPRSPAIGVFLAHAIINRNLNLIKQIIAHKPDVHFDLRHWKILAQLGAIPLAEMEEEIIEGSPFLKRGDSIDEQSSDEELLNISSIPTSAEKEAYISEELAKAKKLKEGEKSQHQETSQSERPANFALTREGRLKDRAEKDVRESCGERSAVVLIEPRRPERFTLAQCQYRRSNLRKWVKHLEALGVEERKKVALRKAFKKSKDDKTFTYRTDFHKFIDNKSDVGFLPRLKALLSAFERAYVECEGKEDSKARTSHAALANELAEEIEGLKFEYEEHNEDINRSNISFLCFHPGDCYAFRRNAAAYLGRGTAYFGRQRKGENDPYDDSDDDTYDFNEDLKRQLENSRKRKERALKLNTSSCRKVQERQGGRHPRGQARSITENQGKAFPTHLSDTSHTSGSDESETENNSDRGKGAKPFPCKGRSQKEKRSRANAKGKDKSKTEGNDRPWKKVRTSRARKKPNPTSSERPGPSRKAKGKQKKVDDHESLSDAESTGGKESEEESVVSTMAEFRATKHDSRQNKLISSSSCSVSSIPSASASASPKKEDERNRNLCSLREKEHTVESHADGSSELSELSDMEEEV